LFYLGKDATPHSLEQLQAQLRALAAQNPKLKLAVNADTNAPWGRLVAVMEAAKDASITNISALTKDAGKP
jgi:biopolymer transport protein ExbD